MKYSVAFTKPEDINVVGSFVLKTSVKHDGPMVIDMAVTMPSVVSILFAQILFLMQFSGSIPG